MSQIQDSSITSSIGPISSINSSQNSKSTSDVVPIRSQIMSSKSKRTKRKKKKTIGSGDSSQVQDQDHENETSARPANNSRKAGSSTNNPAAANTGKSNINNINIASANSPSRNNGDRSGAKTGGGSGGKEKLGSSSSPQFKHHQVHSDNKEESGNKRGWSKPNKNHDKSSDSSNGSPTVALSSTITKQSSTIVVISSQQEAKSSQTDITKMSQLATRSPQHRNQSPTTSLKSHNTNHTSTADRKKDVQGDKFKDGGTELSTLGSSAAKKHKAGKKSTKKNEDDKYPAVSNSSTTKNNNVDMNRSNNTRSIQKRQQQQQKQDSSSEKSTQPAPKSKSTHPPSQPSTKNKNSNHNNNNSNNNSKVNSSDNKNNNNNKNRPLPNKNNNTSDNDNLSANNSNSSTSYSSKNSYLGQRDGLERRRPPQPDYKSKDPSLFNANNNLKPEKPHLQASKRNRNEQGDLHLKKDEGTPEIKISWNETSTNVQKNNMEAQSGWGDDPSIQSGEWGKAKENNEGWSSISETNDGWGSSTAKDRGWGKVTVTNDGWSYAISENNSWNSNPTRNEGWSDALTKTHGKTQQISERNICTAITTPKVKVKREVDLQIEDQEGKKEEASSAASVTGWGEAPSAMTQGDGWSVGQPISKSTPWGESVPWENGNISTDFESSVWYNAVDTTLRRQESKSFNSSGDHSQKRIGAGRGRSLSGSEPRLNFSNQNNQRSSGSFREGHSSGERFQNNGSFRSNPASISQSQQPKNTPATLYDRNDWQRSAPGQRSRDNKTKQGGGPS